MTRPVAGAYQLLQDAGPLVRPSFSQYEVTLLPPYGDPEVHVLGEVATYVVAGTLVNAALDWLDNS